MECHHEDAVAGLGVHLLAWNELSLFDCSHSHHENALHSSTMRWPSCWLQVCLAAYHLGGCSHSLRSSPWPTSPSLGCSMRTSAILGYLVSAPNCSCVELLVLSLPHIPACWLQCCAMSNFGCFWPFCFLCHLFRSPAFCSRRLFGVLGPICHVTDNCFVHFCQLRISEHHSWFVGSKLLSFGSFSSQSLLLYLASNPTFESHLVVSS